MICWMVRSLPAQIIQSSTIQDPQLQFNLYPFSQILDLRVEPEISTHIPHDNSDTNIERLAQEPEVVIHKAEEQPYEI